MIRVGVESADSLAIYEIRTRVVRTRDTALAGLGGVWSSDILDCRNIATIIILPIIGLICISCFAWSILHTPLKLSIREVCDSHFGILGFISMKFIH